MANNEGPGSGNHGKQGATHRMNANMARLGFRVVALLLKDPYRWITVGGLQRELVLGRYAEPSRVLKFLEGRKILRVNKSGPVPMWALALPLPEEES